LPQQPRARAEVPPARPQRAAVVPVPLPAARDAALEHDVNGDVVRNVVTDVVLDGRVAVDVGADLREDLVPGPTHLLVEVAAARAEGLCARLGPVLPAPPDALAPRRPVLPVLAALALVALRLLPGPALEPGPLHDHLRHVGTQGRPFSNSSTCREE